MGLQNAQKTHRPDMIRALIQLRDSELEAAKHLFVVCGQPSTELGLFEAWAKEDPAWLASFMMLRGMIAAMMSKGITP